MVFRISWEDGTLEIYDGVERRATHIAMGEWTATNKSYRFRFPIDEIFSGKCKSISYGPYLTFIRREDDYGIIEEVTPGRTFSLEKGRYIIDVNSYIKVYVRIESPLKVKADNDGTNIYFGSEREIVFGVRSHKRRPAGTIKTTKDLHELANAISLLSSSMKTVTCERSYPTLRGHPPLLEIAKETSIPEGIEKHDSGVSITIPKKLSYLYVVSPLAYYLMADIEFGKPKIHCENGFTHKLPERFPAFEEAVADALRRVFLMDCLVRCAGEHLNQVKELEALERLDMDIKEVFSWEIADQLPTYFGVSTESIRQFASKWHLTYYVKPNFERIQALPFILNDLALIRLPRYNKVSMKELTESALDDFFRSGDVFQIFNEKNLIKPVLDDSQEHAWLSPETPVDIPKSHERAFFNQMKHLDKERSDIKIAMVINSEEMAKEEDLVQRVYKKRDDIPLKVYISHFLEKDDLVEVFSQDFDLVHYVGHCDSHGLACPDGGLRAKDISDIQVPVFFLNACNSYEEGMDLIRGGSVGGVVTTFRVMNEAALKIGFNFSRLMSHGFPLGKAMELARMTTFYGQDYLVLGNGGYTLMQNPKTWSPYYYKIDEMDGSYSLSVNCQAPYIGGYFFPYVKGNNDAYLDFNDATFELPLEEILNTLETFSLPFIYRGRLYWPEDVPQLFKK